MKRLVLILSACVLVALIVALIPQVDAQVSPGSPSPVASPRALSDRDRLATAEAEIDVLQTQVAGLLTQVAESPEPTATATETPASGQQKTLPADSSGREETDPTPTTEPKLEDLVYVYAGQADDIGMSAPIFALDAGRYYGIFDCAKGKDSILMITGENTDDTIILNPGDQYFDVPERLRNLGLFSSCGGSWAVQIYYAGPYDDSNESVPVTSSSGTDEATTLHDIEITIDLHGWDNFAHAQGVGGFCSGKSGFRDIRTGLEITILDGDGAVIASGVADSSEIIDQDTCRISAWIGNVPETPLYQIQLEGREAPSYSLEELETMNWTIQLELGP